MAVQELLKAINATKEHVMDVDSGVTAGEVCQALRKAERPLIAMLAHTTKAASSSASDDQGLGKVSSGASSDNVKGQ